MATVPPTKPVYAHGGGRAEARRVERLVKRELEKLSKQPQPRPADVEPPPTPEEKS